MGNTFPLLQREMSPVMWPGLQRVTELRNPEQLLARAEADQPRRALSPRGALSQGAGLALGWGRQAMTARPSLAILMSRPKPRSRQDETP